MNSFNSLIFAVAIGAVFLLPAGCARRMTVATGTTIGLHATPGDGKSQTPQVTLAYKRSELALVPTGEKAARKKQNENSDAYSALAVIDFQTKWFGRTSVDQFIATGHASRDIQEPGSQFTIALAKEGSRDFVVGSQIYVALRRKATAGDAIARARVRDLDALGELVPDEYTWMEPIAMPVAPAAAQVRRKFERRRGPQNYTSFTTCRQNMIATIAVLQQNQPVTVTEVDNTTITLTDEDRQQELGKQERALQSLRKRAAETGAASRALVYYMETLKE